MNFFKSFLVFKGEFFLFCTKQFSGHRVKKPFTRLLIPTEDQNKLKSLKVAKLKDENGGSDGGDEGCDECFDERSDDR